MSDDWTARFPGLVDLDDGTRSLLIGKSHVISVKKGTIVFGPGKSPDNLILLLDGSVRVQQVSESGREIVLYRVSPGESCVMTTACLLAYDVYSAEGVAETDTRAALIPRVTFDRMMAESGAFRSFVFLTISQRIIDLFSVIEDIAFQRVDIRLAQKLLALSGGGDTVRVTHQALSAELGTAREVVSRYLQEFQKRGWVEQARGEVRLLLRSELSRLGESGH